MSGKRYPLPRRLPPQRGREVRFDVRGGRDWKWTMGRMGGGLSVGVGVLFAAMCGMIGRDKTGVRALLAGWSLGAACMGVAGGCMALSGQSAEAAVWFGYAVVFGGAACMLWWRERRLVLIGTSCAAALLAWDVVGHVMVARAGPAELHHSLSFPVLSFAMLAGAAVLWAARYSAEAAAARGVKEDQAAYGAMWERLREGAGVGEEVARLESLVECAGWSGGEGARVHQRHCEREPSSQGLMTWHVVRWVRGRRWGEGEGEGGKVRSLDQLYAQATCLRPMLRYSLNPGVVMNCARNSPCTDAICLQSSSCLSCTDLVERSAKVQDWALRCNGMFPTVQGTHVRWADANGGIRAGGEVQWAGLKEERRSIEKALGCYDGDVSRLVDVCRERIVFASVRELAECVEAISRDAEVEVVRAKNRMRAGAEAEAEAGAGLRVVVLNLRIRDEDARRFGVDSHVAELQLMLLSFQWLLVTPPPHWCSS